MDEIDFKFGDVKIYLDQFSIIGNSKIFILDR